MESYGFHEIMTLKSFQISSSLKSHKPISPIQGIPVKEWIQAAHDHPSPDVTQSLAEMSDAISHQPTSLTGLLRCHVKQLIY